MEAEEGIEIIDSFINSLGEKEEVKYQIGKLLGKGGFAKCFELIHQKSSKKYAVKIISKQTLQKQRQKQKLFSEIRIHKQLIHTNIVRFEKVFEDNNNVYIVLELCVNQTLNELLRRRKMLSEFEIKIYGKQILNSLQYLHRKLVVHRDLKLANLFISENMFIKLGDFGLASILQNENEKRYTICGTPNYIAPEILNQKGHSLQVDIWSYGIVLYTLLTGNPPFEKQDVKMTYNQIKQGEFTYPTDYLFSESIKNLISSILIKDPHQRISLEDIQNHSFFKENLPQSLPLSTLLCPPSQGYLKSFQSKKINQINDSIGNRNSSLSIQKSRDIYDIFFKQQPPKETPAIDKYRDYTQKWGMGYIMSDGTIGVYFNDKTSLFHNRQTDSLFYVYKDCSKKLVKKFNKNEFNIEQKKKFMLYHYISNQLINNSEGFNMKETNMEIDLSIEYLNDNKIYFVTNCFKSSKCIFFKTNGKLLQANFLDGAVLTFDYKNGILIFMKIDGSQTLHSIQYTVEENSELIKYKNHVKSVLSQITGLYSNQLNHQQ